jgi:hypothetical protein
MNERVKFLKKLLIGMIILILLAGANLAWKLPMGSFSDMSRDWQLNVISSVLLVFMGSIIIGWVIMTLRKIKKNNEA